MQKKYKDTGHACRAKHRTTGISGEPASAIQSLVIHWLIIQRDFAIIISNFRTSANQHMVLRFF